MRLSLYQSATDAGSTATIAPSELMDGIANGACKAEIDRLRFLIADGNAEESGKAKRALNAVTWGGRFRHRSIDGLADYSGLVVVDIDHLDGEQQAAEVRDALRGIARAAFISPSGCGVKVVFNHDSTDPLDHRSAWHAACRAVSDSCPDVGSHQIDASGKDVCRLCFVSHDPGAWYDPASPVLHVEIMARTEEAVAPATDADGKIRVNRHQWCIAVCGKLVRDLGNTLSDQAISAIVRDEWRRRVDGRDPQPNEIENAIAGARAKGYATIPSAEDIDHGSHVAASIMSRSVDTVEEDADPVDAVSRKSEEYNEPMPENLLNVPGLLGKLTAEINRRSVRRQPVLALGGAIAFCGALFGRKIEGPTSAWTNMACLGIGPSTGGKSTSGNVLIQILTECPHGRYVLGPSDMTSEAALMDAMTTRPSLYWFADEFGEFLASGKSAMSNPGKHSLKNSLLFLVGSNWAGKTWTKGYANGKFNKEVFAPSLSVWGVTVADNLWSSMDAMTATGGFLGRFLLFRPDDMAKPPISQTHRGPFDPDVLAEVDWWCQGGGLPAVALATMPSPRQVPQTEDSERIINAFGAMADAEEASLGHRYAVLWGRAYENAHKLALIYAASANKDAPIIDAAAARWACAVAEWSVRSMLGHAMRDISGGEHERRVNLVVGWIRDKSARDGWCRKSSLADRARQLPGRLQELGQILDLLVEAKRVEFEAVKTGGRPGHRFRLRYGQQ